jgi:hypothetical protein
MITNDTLATPTSGIVAKYSTFIHFYDGGINTGDSSDNILTDSKLVTFINGENSPAGFYHHMQGFNYIVFDSAVSLTGIISVPSSVSNRGTFTVLNSASATSLATGLGFTGAYEVVENVVDEVLIDVTVIYDVLTKHYLKMFLDASDKLYVSFMDACFFCTG